MTREEALDIMKYERYTESYCSECPNEGICNHNPLSCSTKTAYDMAIKALEQEPCSDAISRQAVLDIVDRYSISQSNVEDVTQDIISDIMVLPLVNPQEPKTGHWITTPREPQPFDGIDFGGEEKAYYITCSECGYQFTSTSKMTNYRFCPNCGARMAESEDKE